MVKWGCVIKLFDLYDLNINFKLLFQSSFGYYITFWQLVNYDKYNHIKEFQLK
jgi:hypothetical protein